MSKCHSKLPSGVERYCPQCGTRLQEKKDLASEDKPNVVTMSDTVGDIGTGITGNSSILGKDLSYSIEGNVVTIRLSKLSPDILEEMERILTMPIQIDTTQNKSKDVGDAKNANTARSIELVKQQISKFLNQLKEIDAEKGTQIRQINAGELEISTNELVLKDIILKANEYYYNEQYADAVSMYDQATKLDPNNFDIWFNKGYACMQLECYANAIFCFDKYLEKYPNNAMALNNKAYALAEIDRSEEALPIIERSLKINPHSGHALDTIGFILLKLGKYEDALGFFEKAIKKESNHIRWYHKALALEKLGRHSEASGCREMADRLKE
jgi:tetratricopeptide (TPR) repeat protein